MSTHRRQNSPRSRNKPVSSSGKLLGTHVGYPSRTFSHSRAMHNTCSWRFHQPNFSSENFTPSSARKWGRIVRLAPELRRDLQLWTHVSSHPNGKPIQKPVETACLHTDNSGYGWGAVLNEHLEARGFWSAHDECQHITWKELKAVRHVVESFLPHQAGRNVLLHEDNHSICHILAG
jgi:hypothetical protein